MPIAAGELQETSKKQILKACSTQDTMMTPEYEQDPQKTQELLQASLKRSGLW